MDKHKIYIFTLTLTVLSIVVLLAALKETKLDVYLSIYTVCYFFTSALFRPRRRIGDIVGGGLFAVFCVIVGFRVVEILFW